MHGGEGLHGEVNASTDAFSLGIARRATSEACVPVIHGTDSARYQTTWVGSST
jgi:hypothetical protein